jgi:hypothetical protein
MIRGNERMKRTVQQSRSAVMPGYPLWLESIQHFRPISASKQLCLNMKEI